MKRIFRLSGSFAEGAVVASVILICSLSVHAYQPQTPIAIADSLAIELSHAENTSDSLKLMTDIFDLQPEKAPLIQIRRIYYAAKKLGDISLQFDMIRQWIGLGLKWNDKGVINEVIREFEAMPECEDKRQTRVYINVCRGKYHTFRSDAERLSYLRQLLRECADMPDNADPYMCVEKLFVLVHMLSKETKGDLLSKYITLLGKAINELPPIYHSYLRRLFNAFAANNLWINDEYLRSIKCDRNLILQLTGLQKYEQEEQGRRYKDYGFQLYHAFRRILRNYDILSEKEVRDYHNQILRLVATNPNVAKAYNADPTARIGIMDLDGKYAEAIPLLKNLSKHAKNMYDRRMFLRWLIKFADKAGDSATKIEAERKYTEFIDTFINHNKSAERVRELELLYEVNNLRRINTKELLQREQRKTTLLYIAGILFLICLVVFIILYLHAHRRQRACKDEINRLKADLGGLSNCREELSTLRNNIRKSESEKIQILTYLSHELTTPINAIVDYSRLIVENIPDTSANYLSHFASIIEVNAGMLYEIAKDLTEFQMGDREKVPVHKLSIDVNSLAEITAKTVKPQLKNGVSVDFIPGNLSDPIITTDPRRVQIVLLSCISNMALLTEQGTITLSVERDSNTTCTFLITANGKKISEKEARKVFATWDNFEEDAKIAGLGLPNCQMIVNALHATLTLDTDHTDGTRIRFTIPAK